MFTRPFLNPAYGSREQGSTWEFGCSTPTKAMQFMVEAALIISKVHCQSWCSRRKTLIREPFTTDFAHESQILP
eukprot:scaffold279743_cov32-Tisochrysis_lutea.AAC.4